jgi:hypothetical protein
MGFEKMVALKERPNGAAEEKWYAPALLLFQDTSPSHPYPGLKPSADVCRHFVPVESCRPRASLPSAEVCCHFDAGKQKRPALPGVP